MVAENEPIVQQQQARPHHTLSLSDRSKCLENHVAHKIVYTFDTPETFLLPCRKIHSTEFKVIKDNGYAITLEVNLQLRKMC